MSFVNVTPDGVSAAAGNLNSLGIALNSANKAAAASTVGVAAPAADQVSAAVVAVFGKHASEFQVLGAQTVAFNEQFVGALKHGAARYLNAENANARQTLAEAVNAPAQALLGHPLVEPAVASSDAQAAAVSPLGGETPAAGDSAPVVSGETARGPVELWLNGTLTPTGGVLVNSGSLFAATPFVYGFSVLGPFYAALAAFQGGSANFTNAFGGGAFAKALSSLLQTPAATLSTFRFGHTPLAAGSDGGLMGGPVGPLRPNVAWLTPPAGLRAPSS